MNDVIKTSDVFVPGRNPRFTYNPRDDRELEQRLRRYLDDGGAVMTLVGPTKTGKSVLLREVIENPVWIESPGIASVDDFWARVGGELKVFVAGNQSVDNSETMSGGGKVGIPGFIEGGANQTRSTGGSAEQNAIIAPAAEVRRELQASGRVLVIDDFHFIPTAVQVEIIRAIKPLVFNDVRVVVAAISHRMLDVPHAVEDMGGRTDSLILELWSHEELLVIARRGFAILGVLDPDDAIAEILAANSFGSPHLMQKLCRELVRGVNDVNEARAIPIRLDAPDDWDEFFRAHVDPYAGEWFAKLFSGPKRRGSERNEYDLVDDRRVDGYALILAAVARNLPVLEIRRSLLNQAIDELTGGGPKPEAHQVTRFLKHMTLIARRNLSEDVLPEDVLDAEDGSTVFTFSGVEPVLEYVEEGAEPSLSIADPFFAYFIRWGAQPHFEASAD